MNLFVKRKKILKDYTQYHIIIVYYPFMLAILIHGIIVHVDAKIQ